MNEKIFERRDAILRGIKALQERISAARKKMRQAPSWYRPGMPLRNLPGAQKKVAHTLNRIWSGIKRDNGLLTQLRRELEALDQQHFDPRLCIKNALVWLNKLRSAQQLRKELLQDPLTLLEKRRGRIRQDVANAILRFRNRQPGRTINSLEALLDIRGFDKNLLADFMYTGCFRAPPKLPRKPVIGIMLPVRLETRFYPPAGRARGWRLRVRIIPDEPWFNRHDPLADEVELKSVEKLWNDIHPQPLDSDVGRTAWRVFVNKHGGPRAAWLARTFPPLPPDADGRVRIERPENIRAEAFFPRIDGFPFRLELWMARAGKPPARVARLRVKRSKLKIDFPDPEIPDEERWWSSWKEAVDVGLATEINLGPAPPDDIDTLYVVGLGAESPDALFAAHRDAGSLTVMPLGTPSNTVDGEPAAELGQDPETWLQTVISPPAGECASEEIGQALTGNRALLGAIPGGEYDHRTPGLAMVCALWPALWGHAYKDIWGLGRAVHDVAQWAGKYLIPEGPLPPIRIGSQPYGLLPVTSLNKWVSAPGDPYVEEKMREAFLRIRDEWAAIAERSGNVVDANTDRLLQLLGRTASSHAYAYRIFLSLDIIRLLYWAFDGGIYWQELYEYWAQASTAALSFPVQPQREYMAFGWPQDLKIPLVSPTNLPADMSLEQLIRMIVELPPGALASRASVLDIFDGQIPDSLLIRLLMHCMVLTGAEVGRLAKGTTQPFLLEPVAAPAKSETVLEQLARSMSRKSLHSNAPEALLYRKVREAAMRLAEIPEDELERILRATLDTASYRIDPWITAYAWRRLQTMHPSGPRYRLCAYGWVDNPGPGTPGPTEGGLIHAPSDAQVMTGVILRDKAIHDPEPGRWDMDLESDRVRMAEQFGKEVLLGAHIQEVLGREIERLIGDKPTIEALRSQFPIRTEHQGRRVCDGLAILQAQPATLPLSPAQRALLDPLRDFLDAYGDLLVADAVYHVVSGRSEMAGAAMDAAAGLAKPPQLEVLNTPRTGRSVNTTVACILPLASAPSLAAHTSPARVADPAVAAFIENTLGAADSAGWSWQVELDDGTSQQVKLSDLDLAPVDTVMLSEGELEQLVLAAATGTEAISMARGSEKQRDAVRIMNALGSQPLLPEDLAPEQAVDSAIREELAERFARLRQVGELLLAELQIAATGTATVAQRRSALGAALRWGITPLREDDTDETLLLRATRARDAMRSRLDAAPAPADVASLSAREMAMKIAELAAPEGQMVILGRIKLAGLGSFTQEAKRVDSNLNELDQEWLNVVAAVRPPLTRLEAIQMDAVLREAWPPFAAWTNRPGDPWQASEPPGPDGRAPSTRLIALYGPEGTLDNDAANPDMEVAAGLVDRWGETVPDVEHATSVAFGFNAPAARAQQAILIAVPPDVKKMLTTSTLIDILRETRALTRARMVSPEEISAFSAALPSIMLTATGASAVELEP